MTIKKKLLFSTLIFILTAICLGIGLSTAVSTAFAASNTGIQTFYGTESTTHTAANSYATTYTESLSKNTGIKIYGTTNSGSSSTTNTIKVDSSSICIDFSGSKSLYVPEAPSGSLSGVSYYDTSYVFQILSGSTVKWYATYTGSSYSVTSTDSDGNETSTTYYKKVINVNGSSTTTTSTDSSLRQFSPTDFGTNFVSLSDGTYTIKITREYHWQYWKTLLINIPIYNSTSTMTGTLTVDTANPTLTMKGYTSGSTLSGGSYVSERVTFTASDSNFYRIYYKTPSSSSYTYTTSSSYTTGTVNGWYYVYAVDTLGNQSGVYSVYYDNTAPTGTIYSNGTSVTSGSYVNESFSYSATDTGSGIATLYYKTPVSGTYLQYSSGTIIPANSGDGWYYFYAVDNVGLKSEVVSVYLETTAPLVQIYRNGNLAYSKSVTSSGTHDTDIYLQPNDTIRISCDTSSGNVSSNYDLDTDITIGEKYTEDSYTITLTSATGIESNFVYHIVRDKPAITVNGNIYTDGDVLYLNADAAVEWSYDEAITDPADTGVSISAEGNVILNDFIKYSDETGTTLTTADGTETEYILTLTDRADNVCTFVVYIDKLAPGGTWQTDGEELDNGGYTNKSLSFVFDEEGATATYSFNGGEYTSYTSGTVLTADGTHHIVLTDLAGNKSTYVAYIDTVAPTGQLYADNTPVDSGSITNKGIFFSWDGDITATVNGTSYTKNSVLTADDIYTFVLTDYAGNQTKYTITVDTAAPEYNAAKLNESELLISKWYVATVDGSKYSFATYDEALDFACDYEFAENVTVLVLNDVSDFNQTHLIADGSEVRTGEYWLYKSKSNADIYLYYFDRSALDEVIAYYAKSYVSSVNYFIDDGNNSYGEAAESMNDNLLIASDGTQAPALNGFVFTEADGTALYAEFVGGDGTRVAVEYGVAFDEQFSVGGLYKLIETDAAGNETVYYGYLDVSAPELIVSAKIYGESKSVDLTVSYDSLKGIAAYYYESFDVTRIADADRWAVLIVKNGGKTSYYTYGDELPCLDVGGEYLLTVYDRLGNGYSFTVYIIGNPATVSFKNNSDDTAFTLTITLEQSFDTLVSVEICKDGIVLDGVSTDTLTYTFDREGTYTVTLRDNFGRIISQEYTFVKALPSGTLTGVENGGKTKTDVAFSYDNEKYYAVITKDGQAYLTDYNGEIVFAANDENSGYYVIRLIRLTDGDNFCIYTFEIDTTAPAIILSGCDNGTTTNSDVTVMWYDADVQSAVYTLNDSETVVFENGVKLTDEGTYFVTLTDELGNYATAMFTIDKTLDYDILVNNAEATGIDATSSDVCVVNNEDLYVVVTKNGAAFDYGFGQVLSDEGVYGFRIYDDYGNTTSFTIVIDKSVDVVASVGNGVITNDSVIIAAGEKVNVIVTKDGKEYSYNLGSAIEDEGAYKVIIYDAYGNEKTISFQIVKSAKTSLNYTLGDNVEILSVTLGGEAVEVSGNVLNFTTDGTYSIVCRADGEVYVFELTLDTVAPTVSLNGISDGGKGNATVTITDLSEAGSIEVYKDGELIEYELGQELSDYGYYEVKVKDTLGNERIYSFTLEYRMEGGIVALIVIVSLAAIGGGVFLFLKKRKKIK